MRSPPTRRRGRAMRGARRRAARALAMALVVGGALAARSAGAQTWEQLSPEQRDRAMQNFRQYQRMPESSRERLGRRWERFQGMPPDEQQRVRRNLGIYRNLSPEQREDFMQRYQRFQGGRR